MILTNIIFFKGKIEISVSTHIMLGHHCHPSTTVLCDTFRNHRQSLIDVE